MTILQKLLPTGDEHAGKRRHAFRHADQAVRHTEAWEHETFAEEQARWARNDPEYARICEEVQEVRARGGKALLRADEAKAEWDARHAVQRQMSDVIERAHHLSRAREAHRNVPGKLEVG